MLQNVKYWLVPNPLAPCTASSSCQMSIFIHYGKVHDFGCFLLYVVNVHTSSARRKGNEPGTLIIELLKVLWSVFITVVSVVYVDNPKSTLTKSEASRISSKTPWYFTVATFPFSCNRFRKALASSSRRLRSVALRPVVRMLMSIKPVLGSVADCLSASRWSLPKMWQKSGNDIKICYIQKHS